MYFRFLFRQVDLLRRELVRPLLSAVEALPGVLKVVSICATDGRGTAELLAWAAERLPVGPSLYPKDIVRREVHFLGSLGHP